MLLLDFATSTVATATAGAAAAAVLERHYDALDAAQRKVES